MPGETNHPTLLTHPDKNNQLGLLPKRPQWMDARREEILELSDINQVLVQWPNQLTKKRKEGGRDISYMGDEFKMSWPASCAPFFSFFVHGFFRRVIFCDFATFGEISGREVLSQINTRRKPIYRWVLSNILGEFPNSFVSRGVRQPISSFSVPCWSNDRHDWSLVGLALASWVNKEAICTPGISFYLSPFT